MIKVNFKFVWTACIMLMSLAISAQEICDNGIDDDGDMMIDLNDTECDCTNIVPLRLINGIKMVWLLLGLNIFLIRFLSQDLTLLERGLTRSSL